MVTSNFNEIKEIIKNLPHENHQAIEKVQIREAQLTKPPNSLGRLEQITQWHAAWSKTEHISHPRLAIFAANHGIVQQNVSAFPQEVTKQMVENFASGGACINQLCGLHDIDLRVYELNLDQPSQDFSRVPAMTEEQACLAIAYGMTCVEDNVDFLCLGEMGIGNTSVAAAINYALFGGSAEDWVGSGTGVRGDIFQNKINVIESSVNLHKASMGDNALEVLRHVGGFEICAIFGAIIAARMGRVPVLLDGYVCGAAGAIAYALGKEVGVNLLAHCLVGHLSRELGHVRLCEILDKEPLLDLGMCLGEGSGAVLAFGLVRSALACHFGMASFASASVSVAI